MIEKKYMLVALLLIVFGTTKAQQSLPWNEKKCAVVLTYDDALEIDLNTVIPCLDSANLKGTFYLIGGSPVISNNIPAWRLAAQNGHELGNHTLRHPCDGSKQNRSWVSAETDLSKYTVARAVQEIRIANTLLQAIDGKTERTFAFPCGDTKIDTVNFYNLVKTDFAAARGVQDGMQTLTKIDLNNIHSYSMNNTTGEYMINLVKQAIQSNTLLVFLFHGVGGGHSLNVSLEAHQQLIRYLQQHENEIWIAPMIDVAKYVKAKQNINSQ